MGQPFPNPAVGGQTLIRPAIQSPDYVAGTAGWAVKQDGSAQFADLTLTGGSIDGATIDAGTVGTTQLADGAVTTTQIAANTITADNVAVGDTLNPNPYFAGGDRTGWSYSTGVAPTLVQNPAGIGYPWAISVTTNAGLSYPGLFMTGRFAVTPGNPIMFSGWVNTNAQLQMCIDWQNASNGYEAQSSINITTNFGAWQYFSFAADAPTGTSAPVTQAYVYIKIATSSTLGTEAFQATALRVTDVINGGVLQAGTVQAATVETGTTGARVVLDDTGTLSVYNSSGTLVMTLSASGETLTVGPSGQVQVQLSSTSGYGVLTFPMPTLSLAHVAYMVAAEKTGGSGNYGALGIDGPALSASGHGDYVNLSFNSSDSASSANMDFVYFDANGSAHEQGVLDYTGFKILAGLVKGIHPGTGTSPTNAAAEETWQNMTLASGWAAVSGYSYPQYRLNGNGNVELRGSVASSNATNGGTITTLQSGYYNTGYEFEVNAIVHGGAGVTFAGGTFRLQLTTSGALNFAGVATAGSYQLSLDGIMFPLAA